MRTRSGDLSLPRDRALDLTVRLVCRNEHLVGVVENERRQVDWKVMLVWASHFAVVVIKDGIVKRVHKPPTFPWINVPYGQPVPKASAFYRKGLRERKSSDMSGIIPEYWVDLKYGQRAELFEQVYPQQNGYALLMLWLEIEETEDADDERTSKQRLQDQQSRWR
jgi:hypothetical protein